MNIVITGSIAYDYIMRFPGNFLDHVKPDRLQKLSLSFLVDEMVKQRGGCAPNIAYSLALLGERPVVMATAGQDFGEYRSWLEEQGVNTSAIKVVPEVFTASFLVTTDQHLNQIASFYTGAMAHARALSFRDLSTPVDLTIISPNDPEAMEKYPRECRALGIPYIYDPSQQIIRLSGEELLEGTRGARMLIVNEYEFCMIKNKTDLSEIELLSLPESTIITRGEEGSTIHAEDRIWHIPAVPPAPLAEPTGAGDAIRGGVIKGLLRGYPWEITGRIAALAATYVLEQYGTQNHHYTLGEFAERYRNTFGDTPELEILLGQGTNQSSGR